MGASGSTLAESILFPVPRPTYDASLPGLLWINAATNPDAASSGGGARVEGGDSDSPDGKGVFPGLFLKAPSGGSREVVLYFHGNCCDLGDVFDELSVLCSFVDCNILAIEYPSYGLAEACKGSLSMPQCIDTWARAAFEFLLQAGAAPENVIIFGRSIGTGPAARLAAALEGDGKKAGGLVLHAPYVSIHKVVAEYSFLGVHLIPDYWKTDEALRSLHSTPLLLIHGEMDEVIPVAHGKELFEEFQGLKMSAFSEEASHNEYFIVDDVGEPLKKFIFEISNSRHASPLSLDLPSPPIAEWNPSHVAASLRGSESCSDESDACEGAAANPPPSSPSPSSEQRPSCDGDTAAAPRLLGSASQHQHQHQHQYTRQPPPASASFQRLLQSGLLSGDFLREVVTPALEETEGADSLHRAALAGEEE